MNRRTVKIDFSHASNHLRANKEYELAQFVEQTNAILLELLQRVADLEKTVDELD